MVTLVKDDLTNTKNAISHALEYPESSKGVLALLFEHVLNHYDKETLLKLLKEISNEQKN
jgi:hypothetical protein